MDFVALIGNNIGKIVLAFLFIGISILYVPDEPIRDLMNNARDFFLDRMLSGIIFLLYMLAAFLVFICIVNPFVSIADVDANKVILFLLTYLTLRSIKRT